MPFSEVRDVDIELGSLTIPLALKKKCEVVVNGTRSSPAEENTSIMSATFK